MTGIAKVCPVTRMGCCRRCWELVEPMSGLLYVM